MEQKGGYPHQQPPPSYEFSTGVYPQQAYPPGPPPVIQSQQIPLTNNTQQVTYHVQPTVIVTAVGPHPVYVTCPSCQQYTLTRLEHEPSTKTHLMAALLCVVGCFICACLPYCMDSCMNGNHYCSHCGAYIGTYSS